MDIKEITLRRIQAIRDGESAAKEAEELKRATQRLREVELFAPLWAIWEAVMDMPARNFRHMARDTLPMWRHTGHDRATIPGSYLSFYGWDGNQVFSLSARSHHDGRCYIQHNSGSRYDEISLTKAEEILLNHIAKYLITDDEQPK